MGFSFDEMSRFSFDDFLDLMEIYIDSFGVDDNKEEVIQASQSEIDAFFN